MNQVTSIYRDQEVGLVQVLTDPTLFQENLKELQEAEDRAKSIIDLVLPASNLLEITKQVKAESKKLTTIKDKAKVTIETANTQAGVIVEEANLVLEEVRTKKAKIKAQEVQLKENQVSLEGQKKSLESEKENFSNIKSEVEKLKQEYVEKINLLVEARTYLVSVLS